jgi:hypothetical protein
VNFEKFGIKVYKDFNLDEIKKNPPASSFVLFYLKDNQKFIDELKNEDFLEKMPFRIFLVTNETLEDELLKKRICIVGEEEAKSILKKLNEDDPREAVLHLYLLWLKHLYLLWLKHLNQNKGGTFKIFIKRGKEETSKIRIPKEVFEEYEIIRSIYESNPAEDAGITINENSQIKIEVIFTENLNEKWKENEGNKIAYTRHTWQNPQDPFYYEAYSGNSVSFPIYFWWPNDEIEKKLRACLLLENALLSLVIADERICKEKINEDPDYFKHCKLYPIGKFIGENEVEISEMPYILKINNSGVNIKKENSNNDIPEPAILLIHQGVLDKAFKNKEKENLKEKISILKKKFPFIVVTSGRGKPPNTPDNCKFIILSDILINFKENKYPDKLGIINILMNLGRS